MAQGRGFAPPVFFSNPFFSFSARKKRTVSNCQEKKEDAQNRKCIPCRHRVRRSQLHSVSAGAAKTPYPQPSSSFPNCDRFTGSQFGHLEFYNAARDLDDGGRSTSCEYGKTRTSIRRKSRARLWPIEGVWGNHSEGSPTFLFFSSPGAAILFFLYKEKEKNGGAKKLPQSALRADCPLLVEGA